MEALQHFWRMARQRPGKLLFLLLSLGLSFGFVAAVAAMAHTAWFQLPAMAAEQDYVSLSRRTAPDAVEGMALVDLESLQERAPEVGWFYSTESNDTIAIRASDGSVREVSMRQVSGNYFEQLGVRSALGSLSASREGGVAVLSDAFWRQEFGARESAIGDFLRIEDGVTLPIVGVAPPQFDGIFDEPPQAWALGVPSPLAFSDEDTESELQKHRWEPYRYIFGVLPESGTVDSVKKLRALLGDYVFDSGDSGFIQISPTVKMYFGVMDSDRLSIVDGLETRPDARRDTRRKIVWLLCIVALLLAVAFVSLVDFLMAENLARDEEQTVRMAIGATPADVFQRALSENALWIAGVAALAWLAFAYVLDALLGIEPFADYLGMVAAKSRQLGAGAGALLLGAAFLCSVAYVSWFASRTARSLAGDRTQRPRRFARALLCVATASLLAVFSMALRYSEGTRDARLLGNADALIVHTRPGGGVASSGGTITFSSSDDDIKSTAPLMDAIGAIPGVESVAHLSLVPLWDNLRRRATILEGEPELAEMRFYENTISPDFFRTLGVALLAGRQPDSDTSEVALSRSAAVALAGSIDAALGRTIQMRRESFGDSGTDLPVHTVVGIVEDVPYGDYANAQYRAIYSSEMSPTQIAHRFLIAHRGPAQDIVQAMRESPAFAGMEVRPQGTPAALLRQQFVAEHSIGVLLAGASACVFALALAGVANAFARAITTARRDIGTRLALGAEPASLLRHYFGAALGDLLGGAALVCVVALTAAFAAPALAELLDLWLLVPAAVCLTAVCALVGHMLIRRLWRRDAPGGLMRDA